MNWTIVWAEGLAITIIGTLLHFTYALSHHNKFIAIFSAVNESTWEHIKLALSGIFLCMLVDVWWLAGNPNYWLARSLSFVTPIIAIPLMFYGYRAILKVKSCLPLDITLFVIASFLSSLVFAATLTLPALSLFAQILCIFLSIAIIAAYLLLTRFPIPGSPLFVDPLKKPANRPKSRSFAQRPKNIKKHPSHK